MWQCLAPDCDETGDTVQSAVQHRQQASHPDHGEVWK